MIHPRDHISHNLAHASGFNEMNVYSEGFGKIF